jgi:membrane protease YdiL (CAAX protease family)
VKLTHLGIAVALIGPGLVAMISTAIATVPETLAPRAFSLGLFVGLLVAVRSVAAHERLGWRDVGFRCAGWLLPIWAVPVAAFFIFVFGPAALALLAFLNAGSFDTGIEQFGQLPRWYLAVAVVIVAAGEEWLYRGYAIERIERLSGSAWTAGGISLAAFALVHPPVWGPGPAATTLISGGVLTLLYTWRRDVLMLICAHVATDLWGLMRPG